MSNSVLTPSFSRVGATTQINDVPTRATLVVDGNGIPVTASATTAIAAGTGTSATVIKTGPGRLFRILVVQPGTVALNFYDSDTNAAGLIIATIPVSGQTAGNVMIFDMPVTTGITAAVVAGTPAITLSYA